MKLSHDAIDALAGEYVLGTLRGRARRRFEAVARADRAAASRVRQWEEMLTPLAQGVAPVEAPARVWRAIEERTAPQARESSAGLWRGFGLIAAGLATVLLAFFAWISTGERGEPEVVAVLSAQDSGPRVVVSLREPGVMRVRIVKPWAGVEGKSLELWALPAQGAPRSLGLVSNAAAETLIRVSANDARMQGAAALAVSLEPAGGSPTKLPTGPVLCSGAIARVAKT